MNLYYTARNAGIPIETMHGVHYSWKLFQEIHKQRNRNIRDIPAIVEELRLSFPFIKKGLIINEPQKTAIYDKIGEMNERRRKDNLPRIDLSLLRPHMGTSLSIGDDSDKTKITIYWPDNEIVMKDDKGKERWNPQFKWDIKGKLPEPFILTDEMEADFRKQIEVWNDLREKEKAAKQVVSALSGYLLQSGRDLQW